jgi:hypothetical protein
MIPSLEKVPLQIDSSGMAGIVRINGWPDLMIIHRQPKHKLAVKTGVGARKVKNTPSPCSQNYDIFPFPFSPNSFILYKALRAARLSLGRAPAPPLLLAQSDGDPGGAKYKL